MRLGTSPMGYHTERKKKRKEQKDGMISSRSLVVFVKFDRTRWVDGWIYSALPSARTPKNYGGVSGSRSRRTRWARWGARGTWPNSGRPRSWECHVRGEFARIVHATPTWFVTIRPVAANRKMTEPSSVRRATTASVLHESFKELLRLLGLTTTHLHGQRAGWMDL